MLEHIIELCLPTIISACELMGIFVVAVTAGLPHHAHRYRQHGGAGQSACVHFQNGAAGIDVNAHPPDGVDQGKALRRRGGPDRGEHLLPQREGGGAGLRHPAQMPPNSPRS